MLSLRTFARTASRSAAQLSVRSTGRQLSHLRPSTHAQLPWKQASSIQLCAPFHSSSAKRADSQELAAKLQSELDAEIEERDPESLSPNVKEFLESGPFKLEETVGKQEVVLTRQFNDETIKVSFSIADLSAMEEQDDLDDPALYDDEEDLANDIMGQQSGGANTKGSVNQGRTSGGNIKMAPEDHVSPADRDELADDEFADSPVSSFDVHTTITISRPNKGVLLLDALARDGDFLITGLNYYPSEDVANPTTADKQLEQGSLYGGPPFSNLDEDLQRMIETYIEERGIDTRLAMFLPDFIDYKEQKEYLSWLEKVKKFVE